MNFKEGREIAPNIAADVRRKEEEARLRIEREQEEVPEFKEFLAGIDFKLLETLYKEHAKRSGINPDTLNVLGPERIAPRTSRDYGRGSYTNDTNVIAINYRYIQSKCNEERISPNAFLMKVLCHEETHAAANTKCDGVFDEHTGSSEKRSGYRSYAYGEDWFMLFNEGITEKFSRQIFDEYVTAADYVSAHDRKDVLLHVEKNHVYVAAVKLVDVLIGRIAEHAGVPQELVWNALVRGAFEGERLDDPELRSLFEEAFGRGVMRVLEDGESYDFERLTRRLERKPVWARLRARLFNGGGKKPE